MHESEEDLDAKRREVIEFENAKLTDSVSDGQSESERSIPVLYENSIKDLQEFDS